jgi:hypothetical protein
VNVDPLPVASMNALGTNTALEIAQTGKTSVLSYGVYDFWSPLRDYIALHNGLRVLTESASVNIASPINIPFERLGRGIGYDAKVSAWNFPDPWKGGEWHLHDIVDYQIDAFFSIANNAATFRERYLSNFYQVSGWILGGEFLKGTSVVAEEPSGKGRIILFGFRPQYRAQSEVTYKFLFNSLLYSSSTPEVIGGTAASQGAN